MYVKCHIWYLYCAHIYAHIRVNICTHICNGAYMLHTCTLVYVHISAHIFPKVHICSYICLHIWHMYDIYWQICFEYVSYMFHICVFRMGPGLILSVESNQNVESKMKNVESKPRNCGVQNWVAFQELVPSYTEQPVFCTFAWKYHRYANSILDVK